MPRGVIQQRHVKSSGLKVGNLSRSKRVPGNKVFRTTFPADLILWNATSDPSVYYFIYIIDGTSHESNKGQILLKALASIGVLFKSSNSNSGRGRLSVTFAIRNISVLKFCSAPFANFILVLLIRTCCPARKLAFATRT